MDKPKENDPKDQIQSLTSKDVTDTGKAIVRTAVVWTFASLLAQGFKDVLKKIGGKLSG